MIENSIIVGIINRAINQMDALAAETGIEKLLQMISAFDPMAMRAIAFCVLLEVRIAVLEPEVTP